MSQQITRNFWTHETTVSGTAKREGIENVLPDELRPVVYEVAHYLEMVRAILGDRPMVVSSWYRCPELNAAVSGARRSQHLTARAVDFFAGAELSLWQKGIRIASAAERGPFTFGALILYPESGRCHIDFRPGLPRRVMIARGGGDYERVTIDELRELEEDSNAAG